MLCPANAREAGPGCVLDGCTGQLVIDAAGVTRCSACDASYGQAAANEEARECGECEQQLPLSKFEPGRTKCRACNSELARGSLPRNHKQHTATNKLLACWPSKPATSPPDSRSERITGK